MKFSHVMSMNWGHPSIPQNQYSTNHQTDTQKHHRFVMEKESTGTESTVTHPDKIDFSKDQFDTVWTWNLGDVFLNVQIQVLVKFPQKRSGNCEWPIYLCFFFEFPENKMEWIAVSFEGSLVRMGWGKPISLPSVRYNYSMWHQMCQGLNSHDFQ